jgi:hypothetical protein
MYFPKKYGQSKSIPCIFCTDEKPALTFNADGFPCCEKHKASPTPVWRCAQGSVLEVKDGKFGTFFVCGDGCGCLNFNKARELNTGNEKFKIQRQSDV